jgi:hypothetical protein
VAVAGSVAAAVIAAVTLGIWLVPRDSDSLESRADRWLVEIEGSPAGWHNMASAPRAFPISDAVTASAVSWRQLGRSISDRCIAYKLTHASAGQGLLFVIKLSADSAPFPTSPQSTSGGKTIGYWRSGTLVYVLVVEGNERNYRAFLNSAAVPLA